MRDELSEQISRSYSRRKLTNIAVTILLIGASGIAVAPLISVFLYIIARGAPVLSLTFFTEIPKPVGELGGGMANALLGTCTLIVLASFIGLPWGIATGMYLSEYGAKSRFGSLVRFSADMLASIPSIIVGLFVYALIVIPMKRFSAIAGAVALGILMIPTVCRTTEELLKLVPNHIREAGLALGLPRWKVIVWIVLKGSLASITTGIMLAVARVAGETAPLLFTAFNNRFWQSRLDQPISSLPVQIFTYAISPYEDWHGQAWAGALLLVLLVFVMNIITRIAFQQARKRSSRS